MSTIYSSLSNPSGDLKQLQQEFSDLINFFNEPDIEPKTRFQFTLNGTIQDITAHLTEHHNEIRLFHFSGHSGQSGLDFEGEGFDIEHVSKFFNALSSSKKLQCVFLNGCENAEIVKRLDKVPVVIGTKSKIQDTVARKVTLDFFKALIGGESNYEDAFTLALQASHIHDDGFTITRSEGSKLGAAEGEPLNQYFIQFNDKEIAKQQYAFSPKVKSWVKYLTLLLLLLAIGSGFIFKGDIRKLLFGYDCSLVNPIKGKCNFAIGDIASLSNQGDVSLWLFNKITNAATISKALHPMFVDSFQTMIRGASFDRDSLPSTCKYDFNVTGNLEKAGTKVDGILRIFPSLDNQPILDTVFFQLSFFDDKGTVVANYDARNENIFIMHGICIRCLTNNKYAEVRSVIASVANDFDPTHSTETYQMLMSAEATAHMRYKDMDSAVKSLNAVTQAVGNDFAMSAIERKIEIYDSRNLFLRSIDSHTELIDQLEMRTQRPSDFKLSHDVSAYKKGQDKIRLNRASMILKHREKISDDYKKLAIADYTYLQSIQFGRGNFASEIALLKGSLSSSVSTSADTIVSPPPSDWDIDVQLKGKVVNEKGQPIQGAEVQFAIDKDLTNAQGFYNLGTYKRGELKGQSLLVSRKGYQLAQVAITGQSFARIKLKPAIPAFTLKGTVLNESGKPLQGAKVFAMDRTRETDGNGVYSFGEFDRNQVIGQKLSVSLTGFQEKTITISDGNISQITMSAVPAEEEKYTIILNGTNIKQDQFLRLMNDLIQHQLPVDANRSRNNEGAEYFGDRTQTVIYYSDSLKEEAEELAKLLQMMTDQRFMVKPVKGSVYKSIQMPQQTIVIYWYG